MSAAASRPAAPGAAAPGAAALQPRRVNVLIGGAGPAGVIAGRYLQKAGLSVAFVEPRAEATRWNIVSLSDTARDALAETGIADRLRLPDTDTGGVQRLPNDHALSALEKAARSVTAEAGATFHFGQAVDGVRNLGDAGVEVSFTDARTGHRQLLHADLFLNATGGRTGAETQLGMEQLTASGSERYVAGWYDHVPGRRSGFEHTGRITDATGRVVSERTLRVFQNPRDGAAAFMSVPAETDADDSEVVARFLDYASTPVRQPHGAVGPTLVGRRAEPMIFAVQHRIAQRARNGNVIAVGDSLSRAHPGTYSGASRGAQDARDVGELVPAALRDPARRDALLGELELRLMRRHASGVRESLERHGAGTAAARSEYPAMAAVLDRWAPEQVAAHLPLPSMITP